ncbi:uncharacterized protein LOC124420038 [Lucilia cuprina]|uniref:uncharacterized protein LOC124420038 n=1 Tax=Lucilia cuprina TaxID=7375 RepID=UPI001F05BBF7|nr:uncharacterized protein LOC124420038 [Lucilia cuprina]
MSLDNFIRLADSLVEFDSEFNENRLPISSCHAVEVHKLEIKSTWSRIKTAYDKFLADRDNNDDEDDSPVDLDTFRTKYKTTYITYCNLLAKLSELAEKLRQDASSKYDSSPIPTHSIEISRLNTDSYSFNLPPCDIEVFNGDYMLWPTFRDLFTAVYIKNSRLSSVEKLFHLTQKTSGEAREIVQKSPLTNMGFDLAWTNLCTRFENRRILVNLQLKVLFNLQSISSESGIALKQLQRDINSSISALKMYDIDVESWDPIFVFLCSNRLPDTTLTLWEQGLTDKTSIPKWADLDSFLTNRYRTLESVAELRKTNTNSKVSLSTRKINSFQNNIAAPRCPLCPNEFHVIRKCPSFLEMDYPQKFGLIKKLSLCLNCFSKLHLVKNCNSKNSCGHCRKRHNTLLHRDNSDPNELSEGTTSNLNPNSIPFVQSDSDPTTSTTSSGVSIQNCFSMNSNGVLLGTAIVNISHMDVKFRARALIDSGSEGTLISERLFNRLKLPFRKTTATISGLNNTVSATVRKECCFGLSSPLYSGSQISAKALVVPHLAENIPSQTFLPSSFSDLPKIPLADPLFHNSAKIDILLGGDLIPSIMCSGVRTSVCGSLMAQETIFGWILTGPVSTKSTSSNSNIVSYFCEIALDKEISKFWEVEDLPRERFISPSDKKCEELFKMTTRKSPEGRYIVSLPFKEGYPEKLCLGKSRNSALAQFFRNESRLLRDPSLKSEYDRVVQEYEDLNHMSKVCDESLNESLTYYLPHHAVIKPESTTTKVRVVFNASSPSSNGLSLNDILYPGPILQSDLPLLILKWRFFRFVFNADIQKMYRQILVEPKHTPFQRILFRKNPNSSVQDYQLNTVTFGVNCAPYLAIRTLIQLAEDVELENPSASKILKNSMYVDDVLAGEHTITAAIKAKNNLIHALGSAGFSLRKWTANVKDILADLPSNHLLHEDFLDFDDRSTAKTLGIRWNAGSDSFYFVPTEFTEPLKFTKREVLSHIARLFDPAGWLAPCVIVAKILMQQIWAEGTGWDEVLSPQSLAQWKIFQSNYSYIKDIHIPRWINFVPNSNIQFHGFCDASEKAYAAVLYIRISNNDTVFTHLISSKTKVAPLKTISIPRLELCGAALLAEMIDSLLPKLDIERYETVCWTDSTIVLSWLAKPPCFWQTFVANRISKICQIIDPSLWHHVASENNPADIASRGVLPQEMVHNDLWWKGPTFLRFPNEMFQDFDHILETDLEKKPTRCECAAPKTDNFPSFVAVVPISYSGHIYEIYTILSIRKVILNGKPNTPRFLDLAIEHWQSSRSD